MKCFRFMLVSWGTYQKRTKMEPKIKAGRYVICPVFAPSNSGWTTWRKHLTAFEQNIPSYPGVQFPAERPTASQFTQIRVRDITSVYVNFCLSAIRHTWSYYRFQEFSECHCITSDFPNSTLPFPPFLARIFRIFVLPILDRFLQDFVIFRPGKLNQRIGGIFNRLVSFSLFI